jgi:hypothetical protein
MSNITTIYVGNDSVLEVVGLTNDQTGAEINNADVSVYLRTASGASVDGETWPKAMEYVDGSNGLYRVTLPYTLELAAGGRYVATVVADAGPGLHAEWEVEVVARIRN